jgi:hypothetical protein
MIKSFAISWVVGSLLLASCASTAVRGRSASKKKPAEIQQQVDKASTDPLTKEPGQQGTKNDSAKELMIWAAGGWNSCVATQKVPEPGPLGMNMFKNFGPMIQKLREKHPDFKINYVASCFRPDIRSVRYIDSSKPENTKVESKDSFHEIVEEYVSNPKQPLIVLGHSYGGWLTMKALAKLSSLEIPLFISIDPISPKTCHVESVWQWIADKLKGKSLKETDIGCRRSPTDILTEERNQIRSNVSEWYNVWQQDTFDALHADPIEQANNIEIKQDASLAANGHINLGLNKKVWEKLEVIVSKTIGDLE